MASKSNEKPFFCYVDTYGEQLAERDGGWFCRYCGKPLHRNPYENRHTLATVDHNIPSKRGGTDDLRNLVLACWLCNVRKGQKTAREFLGDRFIAVREGRYE